MTKRSIKLLLVPNRRDASQQDTLAGNARRVGAEVARTGDGAAKPT